MAEIKFRVWHKTEKKMYYRGYQKLTHVLLCEDDCGENEGKGNPIKRASYDDCVFLQDTTLEDVNGKPIFEGDRVRIEVGDQTIEGVVDNVPDMCKSRKLHPLHELLARHSIPDNTPNLRITRLGNIYQK